jgi:hypothetical protein
MAANRIAFFFLLPALLLLYLAWDVNPGYAPAMVPFILGAVLIYILAPQINWWWYNRWPSELSKDLTRLLEQFFPYYNKCSPLEQKQFRIRVAMFTMGVDWMPKGFQEDEVPIDVKTMLAAQAIMLTFKKPEYLFKQFEKVIVYPLPFPSPEYPFAHASEMYEADGCLLFSAQQVTQAFIQPDLFFNVALYEYAKVYMLTYPDENYPACTEIDIWDQLEQVSNMNRAFVEATIGLAGINPLPVLIHHYFNFPKTFQARMPEACRQLDEMFGTKSFLGDTQYINAH